ncbi:hypothetical protein ACLOJK_031966 [Asimina triloba]
MAQFFRRLARATAPISFADAFREQTKSKSSGRLNLGGALAAISGGISFCCYFSSPNLCLVVCDLFSEVAALVALKQVFVSPKTSYLPQNRYLDILKAAALNPDKWIEFKLQDTARVSHNSKLFSSDGDSSPLTVVVRTFIMSLGYISYFFDLSRILLFSFDPSAKLGLDVASCIITRAPLGEDADGKMKYVIRPPIEKLRYSPNMKKHIGMIAGGTGITPMLQVIEAILKNPDDFTRVSLLYANISPDDILLKEKLDMLAASHPNLKVYYTVDNPTKNWKGGQGYVSKDTILKGLPHPSADALILVCGPPGMMKHISGDKAKDRSQGEVKGIMRQLHFF